MACWTDLWLVLAFLARVASLAGGTLLLLSSAQFIGVEAVIAFPFLQRSCGTVKAPWARVGPTCLVALWGRIVSTVKTDVAWRALTSDAPTNAELAGWAGTTILRGFDSSLVWVQVCATGAEASVWVCRVIIAVLVVVATCVYASTAGPARNTGQAYRHAWCVSLHAVRAGARAG